MNRADDKSGLLTAFLLASVPLWVHELQERGGPTLDDFERVRSYAQEIAEHGDLILYRSEKKGETARYANKLAEAIAVLAFVPGGIRLFGQAWVEGKQE